jgi:hypothetical protein
MENTSTASRIKTGMKIVVSLAMVIDGISGLILGLFFLISNKLLSALNPDLTVQQGFIPWAVVVAVWLLLYLVLCVLALVLWLKGQRPWAFVISGLALAHMIGIGFVYTFKGLFPFLDVFIFLTLALNMAAIISVLAGWTKARQNRNNG